MAERVSIWVENAPNAFGHFSQVIKFGNSIHISGQLPIDPDSKPPRLVSNDPAEQGAAVFRNLTSVMQACAGQLSNIMSMRFYFIDLKDHGAVDKASKEFFYFTPPARTVIQVVALPFGARFMADAIAELNPVDTKGGPLI